MIGRIHKIYLYTFPILLILLFSSSCAEKPAVMITFETINQYKDGTNITLEGYLDLYSSFKTESNTSCVRLRDIKSESGISVWIQHRDYGKDSEPNRMKPLLLLYKKSDLVVWLNNGTQVGFGARVKITGKLRFTKNGEPYINRVIKIE